MKYIRKYVRFIESEVITKTENKTRPIDPLPISSSEEVVERLSKIYKNLDTDGKSEIDSYFE